MIILASDLNGVRLVFKVLGGCFFLVGPMGHMTCYFLNFISSFPGLVLRQNLIYFFILYLCELLVFSYPYVFLFSLL